ncbi:MAG TPA: shikimate kinase [Actinomycetota bacterium]
MKVWLVGMPASGKTTTGTLLARRLGVPFVDVDLEIESRAGRDVAGIFAEAGEAGFRSLEREAIALLAEDGDAVIAAGGGAVLDPANREAMRASGRVVLLEAPAEMLVARLGDAPRPVTAGADLEALLRDRAEAYAAAAHLRVEADGPPEAIVDRIVQGL